MAAALPAATSRKRILSPCKKLACKLLAPHSRETMAEADIALRMRKPALSLRGRRCLIDLHRRRHAGDQENAIRHVSDLDPHRHALC
jgi:hypothetical protein